MRRLRVYADTSVFGGCFDEEFADESSAFFKEVSGRRFLLVIADVTVRELAFAPEPVRRVLAELSADDVEFIPYSEEIGRLRDAYIAAGVLGETSAGDAEHIASATVAEADLVVSWNFKHIVHFDKIAGFQAVNLLHGYKPIRIYSPREVVEK
jgi:hypothetical protein